MTQPESPTTVSAELAAMRRIVAVLDALDPDTRFRVLRWLSSRYFAAQPTSVSSSAATRPTPTPRLPADL